MNIKGYFKIFITTKVTLFEFNFFIYHNVSGGNFICE